MHYIAFSLLVLAMFCALAGAAWGIRHLWSSGGAAVPLRGRSTSVSAGLSFIEKANLGLTLALILASVLLVLALINCDFSLVYVASYTDRQLPLFYRITAFWAGQAGSMLFWALSVALCGGVFQLTRSYQDLTRETRLWFWVFYLSIMAFFGLVLVAWNNPFLIAHQTPPDGNGLNPLLQNPGMIFHPPLLFLGYGGFVIPGCLALAQSMSGNRNREQGWTDVARPFSLSAWAFLTAGIVLGGWWAYMELGWGGYWAWDPVENASLIPWLVGTAALHTSLIQTRRGKLYGINVFLMSLTTISAFFATYLVRSGVVQSVHAFGSGGIAAPLLVFMALFLVLSIWAASRSRERGGRELAGLDSREGFLILTTWALLALSLIILVATMWPVFTAFWNETIMGAARDVQLDAAGHDHGGAVGLTADFYNRVCLPLFAALASILAVCPWLGWNGGVRNWRKLLLTLCAFAASAGIFYWMGYTKPVALIAASGSVAALVSMALLLSTREIRTFRPSLAACGIHFGVALIALGIAFSGPYTQDAELTLAKGESATLKGYDIRLAELFEGKGPGYVFLEGVLEVRKDGQLVGTVAPQRRIYDKWNGMQFAEASTIPSLGNEVYASLMALDDQGRASVRVSVHPLVNWLWIGGVIMCLLPFLSFRRRTSQEK